MENKYVEIMNQIEVDEAMKARILARIQENGIEKEKWFSSWKQVFPALACILLLCVVGIRYFGIEKNEGNSTTIINPITEAASLKELEQLAGYEIKEITNFPFTLTNVQYVYYDMEDFQLSEITYISDTEELTYRQSIGEEDNSGVYNNYEQKNEIEYNGITITLQGDNNNFKLLTWTSNQYSYSLFVEQGMEESTWMEILNQIIG